MVGCASRRLRVSLSYKNRYLKQSNQGKNAPKKFPKKKAVLKVGQPAIADTTIYGAVTKKKELPHTVQASKCE